MNKFLPYQYKRGVRRLFPIAFLSIPFGCAISLVLGTIIIFSMDQISFWQFWPISFLLLLLIPLTMLVINAIWYTSFTITKDTLTWKTLTGNVYRLHPDEINKAVWRKDKIVLNQKHTINLNKFPLKARLEISTILSNWIPENAVTLEMQQFQRWKQNLSDEIDLNEQIAETNRRKATVLRWICTAVLLIFSLGMIWAFFNEPIDSILFIVTFFSMFVAFCFVVLLKATRYRRILINNKGIVYQKGNQETRFAWKQIEALAFKSRVGQILVWTSKRNQAVTYVGMNPQDANKVLHVIHLHAMVHDIPFGIV